MEQQRGHSPAFVFDTQHDKDMVLTILRGSQDGITKNVSRALSRVGIKNRALILVVEGLVKTTVIALIHAIETAPVEAEVKQ